ncbi:class I SAM-dependent methyltransferase [Halopseudomonas salegens]|uniref:Ribosomal RNA small subunit methyltransferase C n=1 Tax=Halopseudomonas salegens TaxID=1434072 RepID=A0A1H2EK02_9GAMM|nr:class I SAM-dependent methyltransferase [Halopseudomonas salegens]SDT95512.1 16S rRNA m(2)G 1207 methyltransferase [Halopseudomonas salegens]
MDNTSQILMRSAEQFDGRRVLLVNPCADRLLAEMPADWHVWCWDYAPYKALQNLVPAERLSFSHLCPQWSALDAAILVMPKAIERAEYALAQIAPLLDAGTPLYLVGEKNGGVKRAEKLLQPYASAVRKLDSARHCQLWQADMDGLAAPFALLDWEQRLTIDLADQTLELISLPGVFSHGRLDEGSALLLEEPAMLPSGKVLDFGCGSGVLSIALARRNPACQFELVDVDALAIYCAEQSLQLNQVSASVSPSDGLSDVHGRYAAVISNPPFHTGIRQDTGIAERFFNQVTRNLLPGGELRLVANGFLRYPPQIEAHVGPCKVLRETSRFKVYSALAPG